MSATRKALGDPGDESPRLRQLARVPQGRHTRGVDEEELRSVRSERLLGTVADHKLDILRGQLALRVVHDV